jgi:hypothetical protein
MNNNYDNTDDDNRPEKQEDYNPMISKKKEKEFNFISRELESYWDIGRNAAQEVGKRVNILISILHEDHPDWSFNKIANTLSIKFEHLEGFSRATIYRNINESNRRLL